MINFRFHLISIIAVFLALAIGVVMGSAVIDRAIVEGLRTRIDQVERNADARRDENEKLKGDVGRQQDYIDASAPYAVTNRLPNTPVVLFAWRGTDDTVVRNEIVLITAAGGRVSGVVWLEAAWDLAEDRPQQLAAALGTQVGSPAALRELAFARVADRLAGRNVASAGIFSQLDDAGFLTFEPIGEGARPVSPEQYAPVGASAEVLTATAAVPAASSALIEVVTALADADVPTVVGEVYKDTGKKGPARGALVAPIRDATLAAKVSTVDNMELTEGQVAAVLALAAIPSGRVGKFGYGPGTKPVPEWTQP